MLTWAFHETSATYKFEEQFRCPSPHGTVSHIHAIHRDRDDCVTVAYSTGDPQGTGYVGQYSQTGSLVFTSDAITGRVCLTSLNSLGLQVEGDKFGAKCLCFAEMFITDHNDKTVRKYDVYNKGRARFALRVHSSGHCDLMRVTSRGLSDTDFEKVCEVRVRQPVAMDVSKDGRVMAVVEKGVDSVQFFTVGALYPYVTYRGNRSNKQRHRYFFNKLFDPRDVCFFDVNGQECLVVADRLGSFLRLLYADQS